MKKINLWVAWVILIGAVLLSQSVSAAALFNARRDYAVSLSPFSVAIGDLNEDGHPDLAVANSGYMVVSVLLGNGDGTFQSAINYEIGTGPSSVAVGELNGDAYPDLVVTNSGDTNVCVLFGNGNGTFKPVIKFETGNEPTSVKMGDLNGDTQMDLVMANYASNSVSVFINQTGSGGGISIGGGGGGGGCFISNTRVAGISAMGLLAAGRCSLDREQKDQPEADVRIFSLGLLRRTGRWLWPPFVFRKYICGIAVEKEYP